MIEITVHKQLQHDPGMISGLPGIGGFCFKTQYRQIEIINKHIDHPDRVIFFDILVNGFGNKEIWLRDPPLMNRLIR